MVGSWWTAQILQRTRVSLGMKQPSMEASSIALSKKVKRQKSVFTQFKRVNTPLTFV